MAETVGALIVELRANSAQFSAEMDRARKGIKGAGDQASASTHQIAKLAGDGFGAVLPISFQAENAIERFIQKTLNAQGAMGLLAKSVLALGVGFAAFKLGTLIGEFAALGTTVEKYEKASKDALEEQKKFSAEMQNQRTAAINLQKELADLRGEQFKSLELATKLRQTQILGTPGLNQEQKARQLAELEEAALLQVRKIREDNEQKLLDQIQRDRDAQVKTWQQETQILADNLRSRLKLRQDFEAQFGQGGLPGQSAASGLAAVRLFREQIQKEARDLAFAQREGLISETDVTGEREDIRRRAIEEAQRLKQEFSGLPVVLDAIDKSLDSVEFGNFGREMAAARENLAAFVPTSQELQAALGGIASKLIETLPATDAAAEATRVLSAAYLELANAIFQVNIQQSALISQGAAQVQPQ